MPKSNNTSGGDNSDNTCIMTYRRAGGMWAFLVLLAVGALFVGYNGWQNRQIMLNLASLSPSTDKSRIAHENLNATTMKMKEELEQLKLEMAARNNNTAKDLHDQEDVQQLRAQLDAVKKELEAEKQKVKETLDSARKEETSETVDGLKKELEAFKGFLNDKMEAQQDGSDLDRQIAGSLVRSKDGSFIMASKFRSESCVGISADAVEELTRRVAELHREKRQRKEQLQEMGGEIALLWEKLHVPEEEQIAFTESVQGLGLDTIEKGKMELRRLEELKSQMLGKLIQEARQTIADLWEQIDASRDHRESFAPYNVTLEELFTDKLLEEHEDYIHQLQSRLEQMKPILRIIERRETIIRERFEYEELQKDPERLQQRGQPKYYRALDDAAFRCVNTGLDPSTLLGRF